MSEAKGWIFDSNGERIAFSKFGVLWDLQMNCRYGSFQASQIFDNQDEVVAVADDNSVRSVDGKLVGKFKKSLSGERYELIVNELTVGSCINRSGLAAAAIYLIDWGAL
jgi:hypothetical protein